MEEYNLPQEKVNRFKLYEGMNTEQMPKLIAEGRIPMNVSQIMRRRLELRNDKTGINDFYINKYFDTGDGVCYHPDGRIKIVLDSQHLRDMTQDTPRSSGALILSEDVYKALEGEEFNKGKFGNAGNWFSKADVKAHPVWKILARNQGLLNNYADYIFAEGRNNTAMGIHLNQTSGDVPKLRAWYVNNFRNGSNIDGTSFLNINDGCLLGIMLDSNTKRYTLADLQAVDKTIKGLEGTLHPNILKPFIDLRKKLYNNVSK